LERGGSNRQQRKRELEEGLDQKGRKERKAQREDPVHEKGGAKGKHVTK